MRGHYRCDAEISFNVTGIARQSPTNRNYPLLASASRNDYPLVCSARPALAHCFVDVMQPHVGSWE